MKYLLKILGKGSLWCIVILIVYLNIRLYYKPSYVTVDSKSINQDVLRQLNYLKLQFSEGLGEKMQERYPEGFVFVHALYGLAWAELIKGLPSQNTLYQDGLKEVEFAQKALFSAYALNNFPTNLGPGYGIFHAGWSNYLLAKQLMAMPEEDRDSSLLVEFKTKSDKIAKAFEEDSSPYLESYRGLAWPADNMVAMASLALHDQLLEPRYDSLKQDWLRNVKELLDPKTGLIPHEVEPQTGKLMEGAKGSSQSLMNSFLIDIDSTFAVEQFNQYKTLFLDYRFGLPGIREYPKGTKGKMDIDSGPILLQIGGSASVVGLRTMATYGATKEAVGLRNSIEAFGVGYNSNQKKQYLFGLEPMADAFIVWAGSLDIENEEKQLGNWRWSFQLLSILIILFCSALIWW
ncbi:MAG: hypothetical protein GY810_03970 [Aureispira sp.]|nr:hypothetical protein [Aureispira sp.]